MSNVTLCRQAKRGAYAERQNSNADWLTSYLDRLGRKLTHYKSMRQPELQRFVSQVNEYRQKTQKWNDAILKQIIEKFRCDLLHKDLDDGLIAKVFALVSEVSYRTIGMAHFDVQLIGGWVMMKGQLAEMDTGEGKTLTATLPACTAALAGIHVHIISANDYLVTRDAKAMGPIYHAMGLSVGTVTEGMDPESRRAAYACDITYCTHKTVVFDYLRDRLKLGNKRGYYQLQLQHLNKENTDLDKLLLPGLYFAIVDEADSILIDDAQTPLVLSAGGRNELQEQIYQQALTLAGNLQGEIDFNIHHREREIILNENAETRLNQLCQSLHGVWSGKRRRHELIKQALLALHLFVRDKHYLVNAGKVQIIDEQSGRVMADRTWQQGLHQMIEAKEGCEITGNKETLARISYQRFFCRYLHLAGMSGTVSEISSEISKTYGICSVRVPTNRPTKRLAKPDQVYRTAKAKWDAVVNRVVEMTPSCRSILVGTRSVADSEHISSLLSGNGIQHRVLNARQDQQESDIIAEAGQPGRVTVATNMAGRGTDIRLASEVAAQGGLYVIATERNNAYRIDRQLYGRCGRQGDPGSYETLASLEDELVSLYIPAFVINFAGKFASNRNARIDVIGKLLVWIAQRRAEKHSRRMRQGLLKYDEHLDEMLAFTGMRE